MPARGIYLAGRGFVAMSLAIGDPECDAFVDALTNTVSSLERLAR